MADLHSEVQSGRNIMVKTSPARPGTRRLHNAAGVVAFLLLLPIPAYATVTFSPWAGFGTWTDNGSIPASGTDITGSTLAISEPGGTVAKNSTTRFTFTEAIVAQAGRYGQPGSRVELSSQSYGFTLSGGTLTVAISDRAGGNLYTGNNQFTAPAQPSLTSAGPTNVHTAAFGGDTLTVTFTFGSATTQTTWTAGTISLGFKPI